MIETLNLVGRLIIASASPRMSNHPWKGRDQVTWTIKILVGTNHISGMAEAIVVKCCTQVGYVKSQHTDDKWHTQCKSVIRTTVNVNGEWQNLTPSFDACNHISWTAEARVVKLCMEVEYAILGMTDYPLWEWSGSCDPFQVDCSTEST